LPDTADGLRILFQFLTARGSQRICAPAGDHGSLDQTFLLELLERRVNAAGAGLIHAARAFAHFLHQLVAVLGPAGQHRKDRQTEFARFEKSRVAAQSDTSPRKNNVHSERLAHDISYDTTVFVAQAFLPVWFWGEVKPHRQECQRYSSFEN